MIYFLFHTARGVAPFIAIGASLATLVMLILFLLTAGASIRTGSVAKKVNANYDQMNYSKIQQSGYEKLWETHSSGDITKPKSFS